MTTDRLDLDALRAAIDKAHKEIGDVCYAGSSRRIRMSVPPNPERDTDLLVSAALDGAGRALAEVERLRAQLDAPCGSCHPCTNWADETWRAAGRKPPHVHEWDEIREQHAALQDSADLLSRSYAAALDAIRDALASGDTAPIASFAAEAGLSITT